MKIADPYFKEQIWKWENFFGYMIFQILNITQNSC